MKRSNRSRNFAVPQINSMELKACTDGESVKEFIMNTSEVLSSEKQGILKTSTLSASTVVDRVKHWQGTYSVSFNKIMTFCGILNCN